MSPFVENYVATEAAFQAVTVFLYTPLARATPLSEQREVLFLQPLELWNLVVPFSGAP